MQTTITLSISDLGYRNIKLISCKLPRVSKSWTPTLFQTNLSKTEWLTVIFGRKDRYTSAYRVWVKSLIWAENHLRGFHGNGSTIAG